MPKSLWYNVNEKTNFVFTAAEGNFLKKMGFSTVIMNLHQKKKWKKDTTCLRTFGKSCQSSGRQAPCCMLTDKKKTGINGRLRSR